MAIIIITVGDAKCIRDRVRAGSVGRLSWAKNVIHCEIVNLLTRRTAAHIVGMQITYTVDHHHHLRRVVQVAVYLGSTLKNSGVIIIIVVETDK